MTELITKLTPELEAELRRKIAARNKNIAAKKAAQLKTTVGGYLPCDFIKFCRLKAAEGVKMNYSKKSESSDIYTEDDQGRVFVSRDDLNAEYDREAITRHGNDPCKRFDEWGFPGTPAERKFLLEHDFGSLARDSLSTLRNGGWVYAYGEVGNGKTALAMRCAWEMLKEKPSQKASFVSMNQYFLDQIKRNNAEQAAYKRGEAFYDGNLPFRKIVILDDFDKPNLANEHNARVFLDLIERLKDKHLVFITANISMKSLYERYREEWNIKPIIDRIRQMCLILPEFKEKSKRRFQEVK